MTQAQRKKALEEARQLLADADARIAEAKDARTEAHLTVSNWEREVCKNEPLTQAQKNCLILMHKHGIKMRYHHWSGQSWSLDFPGDSKPMPIRRSVFEGLMSREILDSRYKNTGVYGREYSLSEWGEEVAKALAKQDATKEVEG